MKTVKLDLWVTVVQELEIEIELPDEVDCIDVRSFYATRSREVSSRVERAIKDELGVCTEIDGWEVESIEVVP